MNLPLNINFQQIALHLFNFVVLFGILYFLLYKPVKKFMEERIDKYKEMDEEANRNLEETEQIKAQYQEKLDNVEDEIAQTKANMKKRLDEANEIKIKEAREEADKILSEARKTIDREREKMLREAQEQISDMVINATEKIVNASKTEAAFDMFLETTKRGELDEQQ